MGIDEIDLEISLSFFTRGQMSLMKQTCVRLSRIMSAFFVRDTSC